MLRLVPRQQLRVILSPPLQCLTARLIERLEDNPSRDRAHHSGAEFLAASGRSCREAPAMPAELQARLRPRLQGEESAAAARPQPQPKAAQP